MPQLVKGGKHVFGWARIGLAGRICIPPEALSEYGFSSGDELIVIPGSRTSGGFGLTLLQVLSGSPLGAGLAACPDPREFRAGEGEIVAHRGRPHCRVRLRAGVFALPPETLKAFGAEPGGRLLVVRGSGLALGFIARGPIVAAARKHPELEEFLPPSRV